MRAIELDLEQKSVHEIQVERERVWSASETLLNNITTRGEMMIESNGFQAYQRDLKKWIQA